FALVLVQDAAADEHLPLEVELDVVLQRPAVDRDLLVGPLPAQADTTPGADVVLAPARSGRAPHAAVETARARAAEDAVELLDAQALHRIVAVDEDRERRQVARHVERAGGHLDLERVAALDQLRLLPLGEGE